MAIRTKEELLAAVKALLADNTTDAALALYDDIVDTYGDWDERLNGTEDWRRKYEENDSQWRRRYRDRFMGREPEDEKETVIVSEEDEKETVIVSEEDTVQVPQRFEDLFVTKE